MERLREKFIYFMQRTERDFEDIKTEMEVINEKIDKLWSFRSLLLGMAMAASAVTTVIMNVVLAYLEYKK